MIGHDKYDLCWTGTIDPEKIQFNYNSDRHLAISSNQVAEKNKIIENISKSGKKVEIKPLYKFFSLIEKEDSIILNLGYTDFGEYLLTDVTHPEWCDKYGPSIMSNPLSISAITVTSDNFILLGRRSDSVIDQPGMIQTLPGGFIHPPESITDATIHELFEELAVDSNEIIKIIVIGLARMRKSGKPELLLKINLNLSLSEISSRCGIDDWEFIKLDALKNDEHSVRDFFTQHMNSLAPASHATLISFFKQNYGKDI
jgi:hypothetical protein